MIEIQTRPLSLAPELGSAIVPLRRSPPPAPVMRRRRARALLAASLRPRRLAVLGLTLAAALVTLIAGVPVVPAGLVAVGAGHYALAVGVAARRARAAEQARWPHTAPLDPEVAPGDVTVSEVRTAYQSVLRVHEEIRAALTDAERMQASLRALFERCSAVAQMCGRLARLANPLQRYLDQHDSEHIEYEVRRLSEGAQLAADPDAARAYRHASAARAHQLESFEHIQNLRDRILARIEMAVASLESVAALVVKLSALDLEQVELAGTSVVERLQDLGDELAVLESAVDDLAA